MLEQANVAGSREDDIGQHRNQQWRDTNAANLQALEHVLSSWR
jgi:hypothetical protein